MPDTMKCPFREKNGEFADCYGKACMCYYEVLKGVCSDEMMPMCRRIMAQYSSNVPVYVPQSPFPYQRFVYGGTTNL